MLAHSLELSIQANSLISLYILTFARMQWCRRKQVEKIFLGHEFPPTNFLAKKRKQGICYQLAKIFRSFSVTQNLKTTN